MKPLAGPPFEKKPAVLFILPAYNEESKIRELIESIGAVMDGTGSAYTVILVNDGSSDRTLDEAAALLGKLPLKIISHPVNMGVHEAFRSGFTAANAMAGPDDIIMTMDADGTHDVKLTPAMMEKIRQGCDIVIASRFRPGSKIVGVPAYRNFLSYAARFVVSLLFGVKGARDFTIFHRAYRASVIRAMMDHYGDRFIVSTGFTSNTEILLKAWSFYKGRLKICELSCELHYELKAGPSKMRVFQNAMEYFSMIWRLKVSGKG
ncbi:MAG: glycosyltransferase [Thermodesulfobacteriota bacterium]|nr:MAG: glycosyltransferase [Thermodesulfobacteriota bacterium]